MWIEETPNGKYKFCERYTDYLTGKTKKASITLEKNNAQTRKLAQKMLNDIIAEKLSERTADFENCTSEQLVEMYLQDSQSSVKESTYRRNSFSMEAIKRILGSDTLVNKLTAQYVRSRYNVLDKTPTYKNQSLKYFKMLIRWGYRNDIIADDKYLDKIEKFKDTPHSVKIADKYLEKDEISTLLSAMQVGHWKLFTEFLILSGLRSGEAIALTIHDLDFENSIIHVNKTFDPNNHIVTSVKTQCSIRNVYMQTELKNICRAIRAYSLRTRLRTGSSETDVLFLDQKTGKRIRYEAFRKYLMETSGKVLGRTVTPHVLRHTHASLLLAQGVSIDSISRRLGHEDSRVTKEIYLHVTQELVKKDNDQVEKIVLL